MPSSQAGGSSTGMLGMGGAMPSMAGSGGGAGGRAPPIDRDALYQYILDIVNPTRRDFALQELAKNRDNIVDLAPMLWHSFGTVTALLQEIINIYSYLNPPTLSVEQSMRVCNALALMQCMASHKDTRNDFLKAQIPVYVYPFLQTSANVKQLEFLRLSSLGVIGALVKAEEPEVVGFLINTEVIPHCLRIMEIGTELAKTVATFILQKILIDEHGLQCICQTYERFQQVYNALNKMVKAQPSARLLKHIIRCYHRLSEHSKACAAMAVLHPLPTELRDGSFDQLIAEDQSTRKWLPQLVKNVDTFAQNPALVQAASAQAQQQGNNGEGATISNILGIKLGNQSAGNNGGTSTPTNSGGGTNSSSAAANIATSSD